MPKGQKTSTHKDAMKRFFLGLVVFSLFGVANAQFSDLPVTDSCYASVAYMQQQSYINGNPDGTFRGEETVNRAAALKIILTSSEAPIPQNLTQQLFDDVPTNAWFAPYVQAGVERGLIQHPSPDGLFHPARTVNQAEFAKMALSAFAIDPTVYTLPGTANVPSDAWFGPYLRFAVHFGVIETAQPSVELTRCNSAQFVFALLLKGGGLDAQALLLLAEKNLVRSFDFLAEGNLALAGQYAVSADSIAELVLIRLPEDNTVQAATDLTEAMKYTVGAYVAGENGMTENVLDAAKQAWNLAESAKQKQPENTDLAVKMQNLAHEIAKQARGETVE